MFVTTPPTPLRTLAAERIFDSGAQKVSRWNSVELGDMDQRCILACSLDLTCASGSEKDVETVT